MSGLHALASARWYQRLIGAEQTTGYAGGSDLVYSTIELDDKLEHEDFLEPFLKLFLMKGIGTILLLEFLFFEIFLEL